MAADRLAGEKRHGEAQFGASAAIAGRCLTFQAATATKADAVQKQSTQDERPDRHLSATPDPSGCPHAHKADNRTRGERAKRGQV